MNDTGWLETASICGRSIGTKTLRIHQWLAGFALGAALTACGGGGGSSASPEMPDPLAQADDAIAVALAQPANNASCSYEHLYITVEQVRTLQQTGSGEQWREIAMTAPQRIDLIHLHGGLLQALGIAPLTAGRYLEIRFILTAKDGGLANAVQPTSGNLMPLTVPSGAQSGLKLKGPFQVAAGQTADIALEGFDPCASVVQTGNSKYLLKPEMTRAQVVPAVAPETPMASGTIMPLPGGGFVISRHEGTNTWVLQRYGTDKTKVGSEASIVADEGSTIAPLTGGGYVAVWLGPVVQFERFGGSSYYFFTQLFAAEGTPVGGPQQIALTQPFLRSFTAPPANPQIAGLTGGGYVLAWAQLDEAGHFNMYSRRYAADGAAAGAVQLAAMDIKGYLGVTGLSTGGYLVSWNAGARAYGADGAALGSGEAGMPYWNYPDLTAPAALAPLASGGAVIAWLVPASGSEYVRLVPLAPDATALTSGMLVDGSDSSVPSPSHTSAGVAGLADGSFVAVWIEAGEVHARRFAADGSPASGETRINLITTSVSQAAVIPAAGGGFLVSWSGIGADGNRSNYARLFPADGLLDTP